MQWNANVVNTARFTFSINGKLTELKCVCTWSDFLFRFFFCRRRALASVFFWTAVTHQTNKQANRKKNTAPKSNMPPNSLDFNAVVQWNFPAIYVALFDGWSFTCAVSMLQINRLLWHVFLFFFSFDWIGKPAKSNRAKCAFLSFSLFSKFLLSSSSPSSLHVEHEFNTHSVDAIRWYWW